MKENTRKKWVEIKKGRKNGDECGGEEKEDNGVMPELEKPIILISLF